MDEKSRADIERKVLDYFDSGFNCAEALSLAVVEKFGDGSNPDIPRAASGFGGGIGGSKMELCGALAGGVIALGCLWGRSKPKADKKILDDLAVEYRRAFVEAFGSSQCRTILNGLGRQDDMSRCKALTAGAAGILHDLLAGL